MECKLALAQTCHPRSDDVIELAGKYARKAKRHKADILVFPESLMTRFEAAHDDFIHDAESLDGPFSTAVDAIAKQYGLWIIYTMNEAALDGGKPFNTAVITDSEGNKRGYYRKIHLFDSSTVTESSRMSAGNTIFDPIATPFGTVGLGICYDLRFPELARMQALKGCDMLLYPAAWVDGPHKNMQWKNLLRARAIENEIFVAGICRADSGYVGASYIFAPDGTCLARTKKHKHELLCASLDLDAIAQMRKAIPVFEHRRQGLYR